MAPYATAGIGFARVTRDTTRGDSNSTEVGFNVGAAPDGFRIYGGLSLRVRR